MYHTDKKPNTLDRLTKLSEVYILKDDFLKNKAALNIQIYIFISHVYSFFQQHRLIILTGLASITFLSNWYTNGTEIHFEGDIFLL